MVGKRGCPSIPFIVCNLLIMLSLSATVLAQGLPQSPYSAPSVVRGGLDLAPSNPLGLPSAIGPRSSDSILLTPQLFQEILPQIPNLQVGYLYSFGNTVGSGRLTTDFLVPISLGRDSAAFGEAHGEFQDFWKTVTRGANHRVDLSFGGGYRTIRGGNTLLGVNGFFDTTRLGGRWYSSGSVGFEMAALLPGNDAVDLTFNWYGNLFNSDVLANAFRRGPQNYDFQAGYSHELWNGGPDLRLHATGYRFSAGTGVYGGRAGAELKTRDGMFVVRYEAAHDRVNGAYHTVGGFVNLGLELGALLEGKSPFVMPAPIFKSPRNLLRRLTRPVKRAYWQPASTVVSKAAGFAVQVRTAPTNPSNYVRLVGGNSTLELWRNFGPNSRRGLMAFDGTGDRGVAASDINPAGTLGLSVRLRKNQVGPANDVQVIVNFSSVDGGLGGAETPLGTAVVSPSYSFPGATPSDYTYVWTDSSIQSTLAAAGLSVNRVRIFVQRTSAGAVRGFRVLGNGSAWVQLTFNQ